MDNTAFWQGFVKRADEVCFPLRRRGTGSAFLIAAVDRRPGVYYVFYRLKESVRVALALNNTHTQGRNATYLNHLLAHRDEIETEFGDRLEWDNSTSRVIWHVSWYVRPEGTQDLVTDWQVVYDRMIGAMGALQAATARFVADLP